MTAKWQNEICTKDGNSLTTEYSTIHFNFAIIFVSVQHSFRDLRLFSLA